MSIANVLGQNFKACFSDMQNYNLWNQSSQASKEFIKITDGLFLREIKCVHSFVVRKTRGDMTWNSCDWIHFVSKGTFPGISYLRVSISNLLSIPAQESTLRHKMDSVTKQMWEKNGECRLLSCAHNI